MSDDEEMPWRAVDLPEGITKEEIKAHNDGEWKTPKKGDDVTVHYVGTLEDGTEFDSSRARGQPITFCIGVGEVIKGWEKGVATMRKGEIAKFAFQPQFAYGEAGSPPKIPPNAVLTFEIELISFIAKNDVFRDGKAIKIVSEEGKGFEEPREGEEIKFSGKVCGKDGDVLLEFADSEYVVGSKKIENEVLATLAEKVFLGMRLGEKAEVTCEKKYIFPDKDETTVHLHLEEIHKSSDVSFQKDKTVLKKQINDIDEHEKPQDGDKVTLKIESVTDAAKNPLPSFKGPKDVTFALGSGEVCDALESAACEMKKGEHSQIFCTVPSKCVDGKLGLGEISVETVVFTVVMVGFIKSKQELWSLSGDEKLEIALARKEMGGTLFKAKRFELALQKYKHMTDILNQTDRMSNDCKAEAAAMKQTAEMNKAACYLQLDDPTSCLSICNQIIKDDRNNVKAILRRAKAHFKRAEHTDALRDLERVLELEPETAEAKTLIPQIKRAKKAADKETTDAYAKMMQGIGKVGFGKEKKPEVKPPPAPVYEIPKDVVAVAFRIDKKVEPGEHVYVFGAPEGLGEWDVTKGIKMKRIPGPPDYEAMALGKPPKDTNLWEAVVELPVEIGKTEYRYAVKGPAGDRVEEGQKHKMQLTGMGGSRMRCADEWRDQASFRDDDEE